MENEVLFKQTIIPAPWVSENNAESAKRIYKEYLNKLRKYKREGVIEELYKEGVVPFDICMKAIENLTTDPSLEKFWKKAAWYNVVEHIDGLFIRFLKGDKGGLIPIYSNFTITDRNKTLNRAAFHLQELIKTIEQDASTFRYFIPAFSDAAKTANFQLPQPFNIGLFFETLIENLLDQTRREKDPSHKPLPKNSMHDFGMRERGIFIYGISQLLKITHGRFYHTKTAQLLNIIRPDLGTFEPDAIRKWMKNK